MIGERTLKFIILLTSKLMFSHGFYTLNSIEFMVEVFLKLVDLQCRSLGCVERVFQGLIFTKMENFMIHLTMDY